MSSVVIRRKQPRISPIEREVLVLLLAMLASVLVGLLVLSLLVPPAPPAAQTYTLNAPPAASPAPVVPVEPARPSDWEVVPIPLGGQQLNVPGVAGILAVPELFHRVMMIACCRHPTLAR